MQGKQITHKNEMHGKIQAGIHAVASIVGRTLGPGGLPILIERQGQGINGEPLTPMITKDGVTVAGECASSDPLEDVVIQSVKDICRKTNKVAGDGTTTAIVLGKAILDETMKVLEHAPNLNPQAIKNQVEAAVEEVMAMLAEETVECRTLDMIEAVATISANGDTTIGQVIRNAFQAVGVEGIITVDEGGGKDHTLDVVEGFQIRRGAEHQDRFFNNTDRTRFEADDCLVVLFDGKLTAANQVLSVFQCIYQEHQAKMPPILFMANEFSIEALQVILMNKIEGGLTVCAIKNPHQTKVTTAMLDDMAVYMGGNRLGNGNKNLASIEYADLGLAKHVIVDKYTSTFYDGAGDEDAVLERIEQLKAQRATAESPYDAALISDRIASLAEGIAKIGVGGVTDFEVKEKYHRIEDAVNAARAAIAEGVIPGGGATLYRISEKLDASKSMGHALLKNALKAPIFTIMVNLGYSEDVQDVIAASLEPGTTWDGVTNAKVGAIAAGIVDPVKVTKTALRNACSIAALLSTCGGAITYTRS